MGRILASLRGPAGFASAWLSEMPRRADPSPFDPASSVSLSGAHNRLRQVGVTFIRIALQSRESDDLAFVVDGACGLQG